ncbi:uncharacterized protein C8A04DRAFT_32841 [Dichotomopilus funicola]|uniref:Myb-like domain-containing protein n=1 Tax=Dichotomopilus funicola TaxID=1934379 RepID=A0AAN6UV97_9PEZI|nr:hypothetical protein C8A04DRAFT_32841 [Dichotomopilus funicola]
MSPVMQMTSQHGPYTPRSDTIDRHDYGITKNRKPASTGGGRAWSEDEEAYLLQTRMQKMPYKHIAAYLKKTELACRLHYHQLSHGSNRRKRTTSLSSGSSVSGHSPVLHTSITSPIHEHVGAHSRSVTPPDSTYGNTSPNGIQLPSIMSATATNSASPRLPTILPKPASMSLALGSLSGPGSTGTGSPTISRGYPTPLHDLHHSHTMPPMTSTGYQHPPTRSHSTTITGPHPHGHTHPHGPIALRLDCSALPPPVSSTASPPSSSTTSPSRTLPGPPSTSTATSFLGPASHPVDMSRLTAVYNAHRASFWAAVATDYGPGANPVVLEHAWRGSSSALPGGPATGGAAHVGVAAHTPITPVGSPEDKVYSVGGGGQHRGQQGHPAHQNQNQRQQQYGKPDKTRISAILGIDANPRSPSERELVRRIEEERGAVGMGVA